MRTLRRWLLALIGLMALVGSLAAIGSSGRIVERVRRDLQRGWMIVTGRLVDVGGHRLHIEWLGKGNPTVLLGGLVRGSQELGPRALGGGKIHARGRL